MVSRRFGSDLRVFSFKWEWKTVILSFVIGIIGFMIGISCFMIGIWAFVIGILTFMIAITSFMIGKNYYPNFTQFTTFLPHLNGRFSPSEKLQSLKGAFAAAKAFQSRAPKSQKSSAAVEMAAELSCFLHTYYKFLTKTRNDPATYIQVSVNNMQAL